MLIDKIKNLFKSEVKPSIPIGEIAYSESSIYGSRDFPKYNPDLLMGARGFTIYKKMMLDEQVKAVVHFKRDAVTARQYYFEYKSSVLTEEEQNRRISIFNESISVMPGSFVDGLNAIMSAMYSGMSIVEKVYDQKQLLSVDGKTWVVLKALKLKPFETFYFYIDEYGNVERLVQRVSFAENEIDMSRVIHFVCQPDIDLYYGQSELREAYRAWFSKDHIIKFRNIFLERMAGGMAWIETEKGVTIQTGSKVHADLMDILNNIQTKSGILLPSGLKLNIQWPTGKNDNYEAAIASDDKAIAKALLVPNLLGISEQGNTGSYAQSQTQLEAFLWTLDKLALRLSEVLNEQLFKELGDLNFGDGLYPKFCFHPISESMKYNLITKWKELVSVGAVEPTDTDESYLRELLKFPEKGESIKRPTPTLSPAVPSSDLEPGSDDDVDQVDETLQGRAGKYPKNVIELSKIILQRAVKRVDFAAIEQNSSIIETSSISKLIGVMKAISEDLINQVKKYGLSEDLVDLLKIKASLKSKIKLVVSTALKEGWNLGQEQGKKEIEKALLSSTPETKLLVRKKMAAKPLTEDAADIFLNQRSFQIAGDVVDNLRKRVVTIIFNGIKNSWPLDEVVSRISEETDSYSIPQLNTIVRTTTFEAINEARYNFFNSPELGGFVEALEYSAILDGRTSPICQELDGKIYPSDSDMWQTYRPPNHFNCRSLLIAVTELDTWKTSSKPDLLPQEGFG